DKHLADEQTGGMQTLRDGWSQALGLLADEFYAGHSAVEPTVDACRYCQRFSLCRLGEALL
ncbi:MAG: hypothetical protein NWP69_12575, partial [Congregibacter sp.]|nr:hypothetical protein [Congregibacter sp.]